MNSFFLTRKGLLLPVIFLFSILFSCKKDGALSPDFDNGNLSILFTDTFSIKSTVVKDDSSQTDLIPFQLLGVYHDPIFGVKSSSIYTNVGLSGSTIFPQNYTIDSLVLALAYADFYGNPTSSITINVYELSDPLGNTTSHFSNTFSPIKNTLLGAATYIPGASDSTLRVVLTDPTLLSNIQGMTSYLDNTTLNSVLKGLYIVSSDTAGGSPSITQGSGAITTFDLNSSLSKVTVYYKEPAPGDTITFTEDFIINNDVKSYARFINDYTGTDVGKHLNNDPTKNINRIYVSDMEGTRTRIEIPNIKNLANEGSVSINKAEIIFTLENGTDASPDDVLEALTLSAIDSEGNAFDLIDASEGPDHFGGIYNATSKTISFNITRYIQNVINGNITDYGMYLTPNPAIVVPERAVFNSENSPTSKIKLEITYSKL